MMNLERKNAFGVAAWCDYRNIGYGKLGVLHRLFDGYFCPTYNFIYFSLYKY